MIWKTRPRFRRANLAAIDEGDGPTIMMLHGVGLRAEAWNAQIDAFTADGFRVIAPDMPGHGESAPDPSFRTLSDYAGPVASLVDRPTVVIGHSMGAIIAVEVAGRRADHVQGMVALNGIFRRPEAARRGVLERATALDGATSVDPAETLTRWFGDNPSPARTACDSWLRGTKPDAYRQAYLAFAASDGPSDDTLAGLSCPALFMTGSEEPNSTPQMSRQMARLAPKGCAEIVKGAAHMMPMTHFEEVNAALLSFARECLS